jgi:transcriptional regulator with XRE-family HTH domain
MSLGTELRRLRKYHQLTLTKVHAKTGISVGFLSDMERGRTNPSLTTLKKLADLYQTWPSDILRTAEDRQAVTTLIEWHDVEDKLPPPLTTVRVHDRLHGILLAYHFPLCRAWVPCTKPVTLNHVTHWQRVP